MIGFGLTGGGNGLYHYRDRKLQVWEIAQTVAGLDARSDNYDVSRLTAPSLEQMVKDIDAYVASHPFRFSKSDAHNLGAAGFVGFLGGGVVAAVASLLNFPRIAKLAGVKAAIGVGVAVTGIALSDHVRKRATLAAAKSQPPLGA